MVFVSYIFFSREKTEEERCGGEAITLSNEEITKILLENDVKKDSIKIWEETAEYIYYRNINTCSTIELDKRNKTVRNQDDDSETYTMSRAEAGELLALNNVDVDTAENILETSQYVFYQDADTRKIYKIDKKITGIVMVYEEASFNDLCSND